MLRKKAIFKISPRQFSALSEALLCLLLGTGIFTLSIFAQNPTPTPPAEEDLIRVDTKLVQIEAIVKDKKGNVIKDLTVDDFELVEGGKVRPIEFFSFVPIIVSRKNAAAEAEAAETKGIKLHQVKRTLVFIVSNPNIKLTAFINNNYISDVRITSYQRFSLQGLDLSTRFLNKFINENLTENDLVSINDTEANLGALSSFTNDKEVLLAAAKQIRNSLTQGKYPTQNVNLFLRNNDVEWDAGDLVQQNLNTLKMAESAIEQLQKVPGQKMVFLLSRGMLGNSDLPGASVIIQRLKRVIEKANQGKVTFYSLSLRTLGETGPPSTVIQGEDTMRQLAEKTGGRAIVNTNDLSVGFKDILEENSGYYQLAFSPDESPEAKAYQVKINLKRPGLTAQHRSSVYRNEAINEGTDIKETVLRLLRTPFAEGTVKVKLVTKYQPVNKKQGKITTAVNIDPQLFEPAVLENGIREIKLHLGIQVTEPDNIIARQEVKNFSLKLSEESWQQILKEGLVYQFDTTTRKEGTYLIKIAACLNDLHQCGNAESFIPTK